MYDIATALRAFAILRKRFPDSRMTIAGSGPEAGALRTLAAGLGIADAVNFCGTVDRNRMAELYRSASVVLNPSRVDNMPNSVLEAMASGAPVVSTNVGGVPFIVRDGATALLVPPGDAEAMAQAAQRILARLDDVIAGDAPVIQSFAHRAVHFGRQHDSLALAVGFQRFAQHDFALACVVHISGVDKIDSRVERLLNHGD
jgi:glycosyltransferase involved in cell wall biosynthesis